MTMRTQFKMADIVPLAGVVLVSMILIGAPFVLPLVVASSVQTSHCLVISFAIVLYVFIWLFGVMVMLDALAYIYGFRRPIFDGLSRGVRLRLRASTIESPLGAVGACVLSYSLSLYGFWVGYVLLSHLDDQAFNVGALGVLSAAYFTCVTAATVGFGDIVPVSGLARCMVMLEIAVSFVYAVFVFSVIAGIVRDAPSTRK